MILTQEQLNILNYIVVDGQAWADHATKENMLAKVAKYKQPYLDAQGPDYKNRKQRDDAQAQAEKDKYDNAPWNMKREREYPRIGDQLDAMWKGGAEADAMKALVNKVKSDYPKE